MRRVFMFFAVFMLIFPVLLVAQDTEIDVQAYLDAASIIFVTGIGGMAVLGLVEVIKRILKASGAAVRVISVVVSGAAVLIYELGKGFETLEFIILTALVALAANGIYLFPKPK
ncbi:MAG: hypothetical protein ACFFCW_22890 [Candidatus Hodarchaeota archaeon]